MEHQKLLRQMQYQPQPVTALPTAGNFDGQRLTKNKIDYAWDTATTQWLSTQVFHLTFSSRDQPEPFAAGAHTFDLTLAGHAYGTGVQLLDATCGFFAVTVAQTAANYYTLGCVSISTAGAVGAVTLTGTTNTQGFPIGAWRPMEVGFNTGILANDKFQLAFQLTIGLGAPGTFYFSGSLDYRLIG
jgi:hypothetical protein